MSTQPLSSAALAHVARQLDRDWRQLRSRHGSLAAGCSCGAPTASISYAACEHDLIAHLQRKYANDANEAIARVLAAGDATPTLSAIIARLAHELATSTQAQPLLADLRRSIGSLDPRSSRCT